MVYEFQMDLVSKSGGIILVSTPFSSAGSQNDILQSSAQPPIPLPEETIQPRDQELLFREGGLGAKKEERSAQFASAPLFSRNEWPMCSMFSM